MSHTKVTLGTAYLMGAQGIFLVTGYILHIMLGRYLGPAEYGLFSVVFYSATMITTLVTSGLPMAVSRYMSADPDRAETIFHKGLILQLMLTVLISILFFLTAPVLARVLDDEKLVPLFRMLAPMPVFLGVFFLIVQYYNGLSRYMHQSVCLVVYYLLRVLLVVSLAVLGMRVFGAVTGLVAASGITMFLAVITRSPRESNGPFPTSDLVLFAVPLFIASIPLVLVIDLDLMFVKRLIPSASSTGHYTSAKVIARATLPLFLALSSALYPVVSNAYSTRDLTRLRRYIQKAHQVILMVLLPLTIVICWDSAEIISIFFGNDYIEGVPALRWLTFSFSILSIFVVHKAIITGCGFPLISCVLTLSLLPLCIVLQLTLIPVFGMVGAAMASALTIMIGTCCSLTILYVKFKAGFDLASTLRIVTAASLMILLNIVLSWTELVFIPRLIIVAVFYLVALTASGELSRDQLHEFIDHFQSSG